MDPDPIHALMGNISNDGFIVPVEPSDLKTVWTIGQQVQEQHGSNQRIAIDARMFANVCSPGANVMAVWYRMSVLMLIEKQIGLLESPDDDNDVVFNIAAKFPFRPMKPGVVSRGLPQDVQAMVKQMEYELGRLGLESL